MEPAPYFADIAEGPPGGNAVWLRAADGIRLRLALWPLAGARGTVVIFPGRSEYAEKYGPPAAELVRRGYAVAAVDWRGQGLADRLLENPLVGHVARFADYQLDCAAAMAALKDAGMPRPVHLLAHSMGGAIGLRALSRGLPVAAAVFTAPMWGVVVPPVATPVVGALLRAARALGRDDAITPTTGNTPYPLSTSFEGNTLTGDAEMFALLRRQLEARPELQIAGPSLRWLAEARSECAALARLPSPGIAACTFLGTEERIVRPDRIRARMAGWPGGRLEVIEGARHELMHERPAIRAQVFDDAAALFEAA